MEFIEEIKVEHIGESEGLAPTDSSEYFATDYTNLHGLLIMNGLLLHAEPQSAQENCLRQLWFATETLNH